MWCAVSGVAHNVANEGSRIRGREGPVGNLHADYQHRDPGATIQPHLSLVRIDRDVATDDAQNLIAQHREQIGLADHPAFQFEQAPMAEPQRWNPIRSVVYGVTLGSLVGGLMIWGFEGGNRWQDQAGLLLEITAATTLAAVAVSYVQIPVHRGQSFRRIADSIPVIADSF
jgi:hypothetical protein